MDATRIVDGKVVFFKMIATDSDEMRIASFFSQNERKDDQMNHCVPILDSFADEHDPDTSYIVMPLMRAVDEPPFQFVQDVIDFVDQMLEVSLFSDVTNAHPRS